MWYWAVLSFLHYIFIFNSIYPTCLGVQVETILIFPTSPSSVSLARACPLGIEKKAGAAPVSSSLPQLGKQTTSLLHVFVFPTLPVVRLFVDEELPIDVGVEGNVWYLVGNLIWVCLLWALVFEGPLEVVFPSYKFPQM